MRLFLHKRSNIVMFGVWIRFALITMTSARFHPLSQEYIAQLNENQSHWKAGKNFNVSDWYRVRTMASGVWRVHGNGYYSNKYGKMIHNGIIPEFFDARYVWPRCKSIRQIWDQSHCGSCWAVSAAATMSDRVCIHSGQILQVFVSAEDLLSCCSECGDGCLGGEIPRAWWYWEANGIVTGGVHNSSQGCKDYSLPPCEHHVKAQIRPHCDDLRLDTPKCTEECYDKSWTLDGSLTFGGEVKQFATVEDIQLEILENGPVEGAIDVFDDFFSYKSGVYKRISDKYIGGHAVKILGWGMENDIPYWICANSWNSDWGDGGFFKILRGENHCGVEDQVFASIPLASVIRRK